MKNILYNLWAKYKTRRLLCVLLMYIFLKLNAITSCMVLCFRTFVSLRVIRHNNTLCTVYVRFPHLKSITSLSVNMIAFYLFSSPLSPSIFFSELLFSLITLQQYSIFSFYYLVALLLQPT